MPKEKQPKIIPGTYRVESIVRCDGDYDYETLRIVSDDARFGGIIATMQGDAQTGMRTDTANLFAAAPEMYAALESIARGLTNGQKERGETVESIARAAVAKATGVQL